MIRVALKYTLLLLLPMLLWHCGPHEQLPEQIGPFVLDSMAKKYIQFTPGTKWVYKHSKTGELDTVVYDSYSEKMLHFKGNRNEFDRQYIQFNLHSQTYGYTQRYESTQGFVDYPEAKHTFYYYTFVKSQSENGGGGFVGEVYNFSTPFDTNRNVKDGYLTIHLHPTYTVAGQTYSGVVQFEIDTDGTWRDNVGDSWHTAYYWAPQFGLIRREKYMTRYTNDVNYAWDLIAFIPPP